MEPIAPADHPVPEDFCLVLGGPLYQLLLRTGLISPPLQNLRLRIAAIVGLVWLPLPLLTILDGRFASGVKVPFIQDVEVFARLLCAIPLMIIAEVFVHRRTRAITTGFVARQIITERVRPAFDAAVSSATRLRNSIAAEVILLLLVFVTGHHIWSGTMALPSDTWYATVSPSAITYTPAGHWYAFFSVPVFQFILLRWYYRIFIWSRFLFQVSRLDLNLVALHPDRCCGLGFLDSSAVGFAPLLTAHSCVMAGFIANRILHEGTTLAAYQFELAGMTVFLLLIVLGPLCMFLPLLYEARLAGFRTYGPLASRYVIDFLGKWGDGSKTQAEPLLGSPDIQSLADLANGYGVIREVKLVPFGKQGVLRFLAVIALPLLPLVFTMVSADELLKRLVSAIF